MQENVINNSTVEVKPTTTDNPASAANQCFVSLELVRNTNTPATTLAPSKVAYTFPYSPTQRGWHRVIVSEGDKKTEKNVFIPRPISFGGAPPFAVVSTESKRPWRVAIDDKQRLYFTGNYSNDYSIKSVHGNEAVKTTDCVGMQFIRGITVGPGKDGSMAVYVTGNHRVRKYVDRDLVADIGSTESGKQLNHFNDPNGIRWHNNAVYVCDSGNKRIQVLLPDLSGRNTDEIGNQNNESFLKYFKNILEHPEDLDFDTKDLMYVVDSGNKSIAIFDSSRKYTRSINLSESVSPAFPVSLRIVRSVDAAYFYVSDCEKRCIMAYTMEGKFCQEIDIFSSKRNRGHITVTTEGDRTPEIRYDADTEIANRMERPIGLAVDSDGLIYVVNHDSYEIQIFDL